MGRFESAHLAGFGYGPARGEAVGQDLRSVITSLHRSSKHDDRFITLDAVYVNKLPAQGSQSQISHINTLNCTNSGAEKGVFPAPRS